jgi:predicted metal-dependent hydrolase
MSRANTAGPRYVHGQNVNGLRDRKSRRFAIADETMMVRVRESARARTARIIVGPRRPLEVIVPRGTSDAEVDELLEEKRGWVERKVAVAREIAARPPQLGLERPGSIWLGGEELFVERRNGQRSIATLSEGRLVVAGSHEAAPASVKRWYRREARRRIEEVAAREAERLGLSFRSIAIRDPRTRWGSCSRKGNLSFSWRLAVAPPEILEYVVVHELCHLREPSHQKAFWRLLSAARPGWQEQARWLREHGQEVHDYEPSKVLMASLPQRHPMKASDESS